MGIFYAFFRTPPLKRTKSTYYVCENLPNRSRERNNGKFRDGKTSNASMRLVKIQEWSDSIYEVKTPDAWQQRENELLDD